MSGSASRIPQIDKENFNRVCKEYDGAIFENMFKIIFEEQPNIRLEIVTGALVNPEMVRGFAFCYQLIREQLIANEIKDLERLGKL